MSDCVVPKESLVAPQDSLEPWTDWGLKHLRRTCSGLSGFFGCVRVFDRPYKPLTFVWVKIRLRRSELAAEANSSSAML